MFKKLSWPQLLWIHLILSKAINTFCFQVILWQKFTVKLCALWVLLCFKSDAWQLCWLTPIFAGRESPGTVIPISPSLSFRFYRFYHILFIWLSPRHIWNLDSCFPKLNWIWRLLKSTKINSVGEQNPTRVYKRGMAWTATLHSLCQDSGRYQRR